MINMARNLILILIYGYRNILLDLMEEMARMSLLDFNYEMARIIVLDLDLF